MTPLTGRFAPSPSGPLHFGSLVAGLASYCQAKSQQGDWLLRIEDVDTPRVVAGASDQILRDLEAFGFEWDGAVSYQSNHFEKYQHYLDRLLDQGDCYACECTRRTLREQGVPSGPLGQIYPGNCRLKQLALENHSIRLNIEHAQWIKFVDRVYGDFSLNLPESVGDFVLQRADNIYAYHLAVVVDDELQNITEVVRGADLLENTCLHIFLQQRLGFKTPDYMHIPLVNNAQGIKLSKQTGAKALDHQNASKQLLAALSHLGQAPQPDLGKARPPEILQWAVDNWSTVSIPVERPAVSEVTGNGETIMLKSAGDLIKEAQQHIECVDVATAKKIYDENSDAVIVDVREAHSAKESKLTDSINISRGLLEMQVHKVCPEATTVILTHCGGGGRASLAARTLKELGYGEVYAITAPFDEIKETFG